MDKLIVYGIPTSGKTEAMKSLIESGSDINCIDTDIIAFDMGAEASSLGEWYSIGDNYEKVVSIVKDQLHEDGQTYVFTNLHLFNEDEICEYPFEIYTRPASDIDYYFEQREAGSSPGLSEILDWTDNDEFKYLKNIKSKKIIRMQLKRGQFISDYVY